jgi:hypothetical protein
MRCDVFCDESPSLTEIHHISVRNDRISLRSYLGIFSYLNGLDLYRFPWVDISRLAYRLLAGLLARQALTTRLCRYSAGHMQRRKL